MLKAQLTQEALASSDPQQQQMLTHARGVLDIAKETYFGRNNTLDSEEYDRFMEGAIGNDKIARVKGIEHLTNNLKGNENIEFHLTKDVAEKLQQELSQIDATEPKSIAPNALSNQFDGIDRRGEAQVPIVQQDAPTHTNEKPLELNS